jgi:hypothetical protein
MKFDTGSKEIPENDFTVSLLNISLDIPHYYFIWMKRMLKKAKNAYTKYF